MINQYHAKIIDRLREAADTHGEVAEMLRVFSVSFASMADGRDCFSGTEKDRAYLLAMLDAAAFVGLDRNTPECG